MRIIISSGHGMYVPGAIGLIDEVEEARRVTDRLRDILKDSGIDVIIFHENEARKQRDNVNAIINFHNSHTRDLDVSIHFNSTQTGEIEDRAIGVETLYKTKNPYTKILAEKISAAISSSSGLRNRGAVPRDNIGVLTRTSAQAILIEVCFVVSRTDVKLYQQFFEEICQSIATILVQAKSFHSWPVSEKNITAMKYLDVITEPEYWRGVTNVEWLDQLLTNAAVPNKLDRRINNGVCDVNNAIDVLTKAKIITSPEYWKGLLLSDNQGSNLGQLLINLSNRSRDVLERIITAEARSEDLKGKILVGNVILNRHQSPDFPDGIYNVVFQSGINSHGVLVHQFTPVANGAYVSASPLESTQAAVDQVLLGIDESQGALFFISNHAVHGSWHEQSLTQLFVHGGHTFFSPA